MKVIAIFANARNGVIGNKNELPWQLSGDLRHFKKVTSGYTVIMGRKTFDSIGKALPKRRNIVISRNGDFSADGIELASSIQVALDMCRKESKVFIIGGATIYDLAFQSGLVDLVHQTLVEAEVEGDTKINFPLDGWTMIAREHFPADEKNEYPYTFINWEKSDSES